MSLFDNIASILSRSRSVILTTHITPDGDGLGSALGLSRYLRARGKKTRVINCSAMPPNLRWMVQDGEFTVWSADHHEQRLRGADAVVATDLGNASRLGRMEQPVRRASGTRILIDHHIYQNDLFDLPLIVVEASSSAEIAYDLIRHMGGEITPDIAEPLYVGVISDTGNFSYSGTTPRAHRIAAELLEAGVEPQAVWRRLHCQVPQRKMRFLGDRLANLNFAEEGRLVWTAIDSARLKTFGIPARDAFEVVNYFLNIKGVELGLLFMQVSETLTKVSLRSAGGPDVCEIARRHAGGGHRFAAGCTVDGPRYEEAIRILLEEAAAALAGSDAEGRSLADR